MHGDVYLCFALYGTLSKLQLLGLVRIITLYKRGKKMIFTVILAYMNIALFLTFTILGIYALILLIKALKIYINKNS